MTRLVIKLNNEIVDHIELEQGTIKIGRKPGCGIVLDDLAVSGEHAHIFTLGEDSFVQDLKSTNGTFVNRARSNKHHLRHGDVIGIGRYALLYLQSAAARPVENAGSDYARTVIISAGAPAPEAAIPASPEADGHRPAVLHVLNGKSERRRIELTRAVTNLGKTGRSAGVITRTEDGYLLRPSGQADKAKVNGRLVGAAGVQLRNGDIIEVAGTRLQFYLQVELTAAKLTAAKTQKRKE